MTIDEILEKYDGVIRKTIAGRCDSDVFNDRYQDTILNIMKYLDTINSHPNPIAYIITVAKHCARPNNKANRKMITYGGWTDEDGEDTTEEWLLEDDTHSPERVLERRAELKQRARAEDWAAINTTLQKPPKPVNRPIHIKELDSKRFYPKGAWQPILDAKQNLKDLLKSIKMSMKDCGYSFQKQFMGTGKPSGCRINAWDYNPTIRIKHSLRQQIKGAKNERPKQPCRTQRGNV